jgi:L-asparaginase
VSVRKVALITTGGTIEKIYDESSGTLSNRRSIIDQMLEELRLEATDVIPIPLMSKDSQDMTEEDRTRIVGGVRAALELAGGPGDGVVVLHGTDTLGLTGERILEKIPDPPVPIVLTGAMRPFEMKRSDALQNLTEALFAAGLLPPGVYCVVHGRVLPFPGVRKDAARGTFVRG